MCPQWHKSVFLSFSCTVLRLSWFNGCRNIKRIIASTKATSKKAVERRQVTTWRWNNSTPVSLTTYPTVPGITRSQLLQAFQRIYKPLCKFCLVSAFIQRCCLDFLLFLDFLFSFRFRFWSRLLWVHVKYLHILSCVLCTKCLKGLLFIIYLLIYLLLLFTY